MVLRPGLKPYWRSFKTPSTHLLSLASIILVWMFPEGYINFNHLWLSLKVFSSFYRMRLIAPFCKSNGSFPVLLALLNILSISCLQQLHRSTVITNWDYFLHFGDCCSYFNHSIGIFLLFPSLPKITFLVVTNHLCIGFIYEAAKIFPPAFSIFFLVLWEVDYLCLSLLR